MHTADHPTTALWPLAFEPARRRLTQPSYLLHLVLVVVDLAAAVLFLTGTTGAMFGSSDDMAIIPGVYRMQQPQLYHQDLAYGSSDQGGFNYHEFGQSILFLLSHWLPLEWAVLVSLTVWRLCLVVALRQLASQLSGRPVPALAVALLLMGAPFLAGYWLTSNFYAIQFAALALGLLSLTDFVGGRLWRGGFWLLLAVLYHPLIGAESLALAGCAWWWQARPKLKRIALAGVLGGVLGLVGGLLWFYTRAGNWVYWASIAQIKLFIRGPSHLWPLAWDKPVLANFGLAIFLSGAFWLAYREQKLQRVSFVALTCALGVSIGIVNNVRFFDPMLAIADPFEMGPLLLALIYALALALLARRIAAGYYLSSLLVFLAPSFQSRLIVLLTLLLLDGFLARYKVRLAKLGTFGSDIGMGAGCLLVLASTQRLVPVEWLEAIPAAVWQRSLQVGMAAALGLLGAQIVRRRPSLTALAVLAAGAYIGLGYAGHTLDWFRVNVSLEPSWREVCDFAAQETPIDAVFIVPPDTYNFQYCSQRSTFVTFKEFPFQLDRVQEWYKRMKLLHVLPENPHPERIATPVPVDYQAYQALTANDFLRLQQAYPFIGYAIVRREVNLPLPVVFHNRTYKVYAVNDAHFEALRLQQEALANRLVKQALLYVDFSQSISALGQTVITASSGQTLTVEGPALWGVSPTDTGRALTIADTTRVTLPPTALRRSQGTIALWARLQDPVKPYSDLVCVDSGKTLCLDYYAGGSQVLATYNGTLIGRSQALTDRAWHHYALTWQDGQQVLYVDGQAESQGTEPAIVGTTERVALGWLGYRDGEQWSGNLASVITFDRVLTPGEVMALAQAGLDPAHLP